jgi:hypothetical protein
MPAPSLPVAVPSRERLPVGAPQPVATSRVVPPSVRGFVGAALGRLSETARFCRLDAWGRYARGWQYQARTYDEVGCYPGTTVAAPVAGLVPWAHRQVRAVNNLCADIIDQLTQWSVVGTSWCHLSVPGDEDASAWLAGLEQTSELAHATAECVAMAGGRGTAVVSAAWYKDDQDPEAGGAVRFETHQPQLCWPLSWADPRRLVPHEVVKLFRPYDPYKPKNYRPPADGEGVYTLRYWSGQAPDGTPGVEAYYSVQKNARGEWAIAELVPTVEHGSKRCPVFWVPRGDVSEEDGFDGQPFYAGSEGLIDAANELAQAGDNTSKRNADDTLVIKDDAANAGNVIKKGAIGAIFSKGGAEYLSQKGDSAKVLYELAAERGNQAYRQSHVVKVDLETLGRATSGVALQRIYFSQTNEADDVRTWVERWFLAPALVWMLDTSRDLAAAGLTLRMPLLETVDKETGEVRYELRVPGTSRAVDIVWPQAFPPTPEDGKTASETVKNGVGAGAMSLETAVKTLQSAGVPIDTIEAELGRLREDAKDKAENSALSVGLSTAAEVAADPSAGKAGDLEDEPKGKDA